MLILLVINLFFGNVFDEQKIPNMVKVGDLYVDKTEICNIDYMEFLYFREKELDSAAYALLLPKSENYWYQDPAYRDAPIVYISFEQAVAYCEWRSEVVSEKLGEKITFRLPSKQEWDELAQVMLATDSRRIAKDYKRTLRKLKKNKEGFGFYLMEKSDYRKNRVVHFFDNVSEMTADKGIATGTNNHELLKPEENVKHIFTYKGPSLYLGFRCVADAE